MNPLSRLLLPQLVSFLSFPKMILDNSQRTKCEALHSALLLACRLKSEDKLRANSRSFSSWLEPNWSFYLKRIRLMSCGCDSFWLLTDFYLHGSRRRRQMKLLALEGRTYHWCFKYLNISTLLNAALVGNIYAMPHHLGLGRSFRRNELSEQKVYHRREMIL